MATWDGVSSEPLQITVTEATDVSVTTRWEDGGTLACRPAQVTLQLMANGLEYDSIALGTDETPSQVATISVLPVPIPLTIPLSTTVATDGSELDHVRVGLSTFTVSSHASAKIMVAPVCCMLWLAGVSLIPLPVTLTLLSAVTLPR